MRAARWLGVLVIAAAAVVVAIDLAEPPTRAHDDGVAFYTCPMDPSVESTRPANCPICGMALTPVAAGDRASGVVRIAPETRQRVGLQVAAVETRPRRRHVLATGEVVGGPCSKAQRCGVIAARVYRGDAGEVKAGRSVSVRVDALSLMELTGTVVEAADGVRVEVDDPDQLLRPGLRAELQLDVELPPALAVPASAVVRAGTRRIVFVDHGGRFEPRTPKLGEALDGFVDVVDGLVAGDKVLVSGTFLVAAESRIRGGAVWSAKP